MNEQKEIVVSSLSEYFDAVSSFNSNLIRNGAEKNEELLFRGHSDCAYKLLPSIGRNRVARAPLPFSMRKGILSKPQKAVCPMCLRTICFR